MAKTLAELRASQHVGRPERTHPVCVARRLTARYEALMEEEEDLRAERVEVAPASDVEAKSNRRVGEGPPDRVAEIDARLAEIDAEQDELAAEMEDHTGDVLLRATLPAEWQRWVIQHPARDEGEPGFRSDYLVTGLVCDSDALIADLGLWVAAWNDEPVEDWAFIADNAPRGSLKRLASLVTEMHEGEDVTVPKSRRASSGTSAGANG